MDWTLLIKSIGKALDALIVKFLHGKTTTPLPIETPAQPVVPPAPPVKTPEHNFLEHFCTAIRDFEGKPGDLNYINNNPGNCRCSPQGYAAMYGTVKCVGNFAVFSSYALGWLYLNNLVHERIKAHPEWTFYDFFGDPKAGWAPSSDGNNPKHYAEVVAKEMHVLPTTKLSQLL